MSQALRCIGVRGRLVAVAKRRYAQVMSLLNDFTARYSSSEAWLYDRYIAPAVMDMGETVVDDYLRLLPQGAEVLEVGCGGGQFAQSQLDKRSDLRWVGLDVSAAQIARARQRNAKHESASFVVGDALELPFPDARFDALVSIASIKHWSDQGKGLAECARVLRPGGQLLVVEADRGCRLDDARSFVARWRFPAMTRPLNLLLFRTLVAGRSLDLDDARVLMGDLPLAIWGVSRVEGTPAILMRGERRSPDA
jgi:ubiquinone/menaquinone biosynthesis C-methylase UbiE